jgi:hypothetical protein
VYICGGILRIPVGTELTSYREVVEIVNKTDVILAKNLPL